jgi:ABC-type multidrug transport system permease subunit
VLANVTFALWSMGIGALRLSTVVANVVGGLLVMIFMLAGGFMIDRKALSKSAILNFLVTIDPMSYAFESIMINEFHSATTKVNI